MQKSVLDLSQIKRAQFNVQKYSASGQKILPYSRRDYYKIWIIPSEGHLHYANKTIHIDRPAIVFSNPLVPYSFESAGPWGTGYMCIFTDEFFKNGGRQDILQLPPFKVGQNTVFFPTESQLPHIHELYEKMLEEINSEYQHKYDILRNYVSLLIYEVLKMQPVTSSIKQHDATTRIAGLFMDLLERQFPIDSPERILKLRKPADYAFHLSIHVNHLNHAISTVTGKSTTTHITERIINEAEALLLNTDWSVADISYCLGFAYPTYFNNFFKKNAGRTPLSLRK
ncbi:helix-turn-helix domain-containing protein [Sporocytophaga myxococcoides]|uniref:helix-turn-helix domain-containing protein n=1 Tax=Sporocytophaga myxococcoides TaxID=153721 RepID=UPI00040382CA|nr:helix-turn-helix domain-containing protein [Sporocytophaga myxococcoides]